MKGKKIDINNKIMFKNLITFAAFFLAFVILKRGGGATLEGALSFGLFAAGLFLNFGVFTLPLAYCLSGLTGGLFAVLFQAGVLFIAKIVHIKFKFRLNKWLMILYCLIAQIFPILFQLNSSAILFLRLINVGICIIFTFICFAVLRAIFIRGLKYKLGSDEIICLCAVIIAFTKGISDINIMGIELVRILTPILLLFSLYIIGSGGCLTLGLIIGIGVSLNTGEIVPIAIYGIWAVCAVMFKSNRYLATLSILLGDLILGYFFKVYGNLNLETILSILLGCAAFSIVPNKLINTLKDHLGGDNEKYASRHLINRQRISTSKKLYELSEIFFQMQVSFKSMVKGVMTPEKAKIALSKEVSECVCTDCPEKLKCWRVNIKQTEDTFIAIVEAGLNRGRATLLDLNSYITNRCSRTSSLINAVNQSVSNYKQYYSATANYDNSRLLIGDQLGGVSQILKSLSFSSRDNIVFDSEKEKEIMEELTYNGILTKEVLFYLDDKDINVTVVVNSKDVDKLKLTKLLSSIIKTSLIITSEEKSNSDNWVVISLSPIPNMEVIFGVSGIKKSGSSISGDTHSFVRLSKDKVLIALCDGMGSGMDAESASSTAISLVENFYKAGFDNDLILSSVNKLLAINSGEVFTAVDICVVNLISGATDFIKIGAPLGVVKMGTVVEYIQSGSLPLGVLDEMKPIITRKALAHGDIIVMVSDGILDSFAEPNLFAQEVYQTTLANPQLIADMILEKALNNCNKIPKDDMTVVVARIC